MGRTTRKEPLYPYHRRPPSICTADCLRYPSDCTSGIQYRFYPQIIWKNTSSSPFWWENTGFFHSVFSSRHIRRSDSIAAWVDEDFVGERYGLLLPTWRYVPKNAASHLFRYGFYTYTDWVYRRTGYPCRCRRPGKSHHRACDAWRNWL